MNHCCVKGLFKSLLDIIIISLFILCFTRVVTYFRSLIFTHIFVKSIALYQNIILRLHLQVMVSKGGQPVHPLDPHPGRPPCSDAYHLATGVFTSLDPMGTFLPKCQLLRAPRKVVTRKSVNSLKIR